MVKTILFDFDGTVGDTNSLIYDSFVHTFNVYNIKYTDHDIYQAFGPTLHHTFSKYSNDLNVIDEMIKTYRKFNISNHDSYVTAFPYVVDTIKKLHGLGYKMGIVSSKKTDLVIHGAKLVGVYDYMDCILGCDDCINHKPHPEIIYKALELLNSDNAIIVGDNPSDIKAAHNASCIAVGVSYSVKLDELINENPEYMIDTFDQLLDVVGDINEI